MSESKQIKKASDTFIQVVEDTTINKKNCKLCQSKYREEAEAIFETKTMKAAERFLIEKGEQISYLSIRNHLTKHYMGTQRLNSVKEWLEEINKFSDGNYNRRINLHGRINALMREFVVIAAETDGQNLDERRRSSDILKKLSDAISGLEDKVDEIDNEFSVGEIIIENLQELLASRMKRTTSEEVKREFMDLLNDLSENMTGLFIDQKQK